VSSAEFKIILNRFKKKVGEIIKRDNVPLICFDLDETLTVSFGGPLAEGVVELLSKLAESGLPFGINTGADIGWFGQRVLRMTEDFFHWPFMILNNGEEIYIWIKTLQAYKRVEIKAKDKGGALMELANFLEIPIGCSVFIGDFPQGMPGIDDSILKYPLGIIVAQGKVRPPEDIKVAYEKTFLIRPYKLEPPWIGPEATLCYLRAFLEVVSYKNSIKQAWEQTVLRVFNFSSYLERPIKISVLKPGFVYAGKEDENGYWRIESIQVIPLVKTKTGTYQAEIRDNTLNAVTFFWYDEHDLKAHWEGRNLVITQYPVDFE